jgi:hypothetical protein
LLVGDQQGQFRSLYMHNPNGVLQVLSPGVYQYLSGNKILSPVMKQLALLRHCWSLTNKT